MELKDNVQGVVLGLFGAYAGGYLADLTSQAENGNPVDVAAGLVSLQPPLLGVDLADDSVWVDTILGHLGVSSTSAAYTAAAAWANGSLDAGASRAEVIIAAVVYLLGDDVEAQYADVATAFKADVAAGVTWSEGDGKDVLGIGDLREEAGNPATGSSFNLTAALTTLLAAQADVAEFVAAWGEENDVDDATEADITGAVTDVENDINGLYPDYVPAESAAQKAAALTLIEADLAAALEAAQDDLADSTEDVAAVSGLKTAIDRFITAYDASEDAIAAYDLADIAEDDALAAAEVYYAITAGAGGSYDYLTYNATTDRYTNEAEAADLVADGLTAGEAAAYLTKLTALANAYSAQQAADEAASDAEDLAQVRLDTIASIDATYVADGLVTTGATAAAELAGIANAYALDAGAVSDAQDDIDELAELVADLAAAKVDADALEALTDAVDDAVTALEDEGFAVELPGTDSDGDDNLSNNLDFVATADSDVFVISTSLKETADFDNDTTVADYEYADITIDNFGFQGDDVIYASGWTLGADIDEGNDSVLEMFIEQDGANTLITFEATAFGSNAATAEVFTVTLTGVAAADVSFSNGYIQVA